MKIRVLIFLLLLIASTAVASAVNTPNASAEVPVLLRELDGLIARRGEFLVRHERRIDSLKQELRRKNLGLAARYELTAHLAECYFAYQSDSTICYLRQNVELAEQAGDTDRALHAKSVMALSYNLNGRFLEADHLLATLRDTLSMSPKTLAVYYQAQHLFYRECRSRSEPGVLRQQLEARERYYAQQGLAVGSDPVRHAYFAYRFADDETTHRWAAAVCDSVLMNLAPDTHDYAKVAYYKSCAEAARGCSDARFVWLIRAAMADVQAAVRDYGALGAVAEELLERGDAARAMRYIRVAVNDTRLYNSPNRSWRDMAILPRIEKAYSERSERLRMMYVVLIVVVALFALLAVAGILFVLRQNRRLNVAQQTLRESNGKLEELARSLRETNDRLTRQNVCIADANRIKEVYIGSFLQTISEYINKLADTYRYVNKMLRDERIADLRAEYARSNVRNDELKEFYALFDRTFLELFPSFIGEFNELLTPDARIAVRHLGSLTTELRIYALIRLGIDDTTTIAALLHCSVNTVYNYRSRMRLRVCDTEADFELQVLRIGISERVG